MRQEPWLDFYKVTVLAALEEPYDVEEEIDAHNLQEYIDRLIDELPPRRREIFNLSRKEQKSYKEIAILLNISEKTVENQISEALKYLKKNITLLLLFIWLNVFCLLSLIIIYLISKKVMGSNRNYYRI